MIVSEKDITKLEVMDNYLLLNGGIIMVVIFDIEASCESRKINPNYNMETIEIGAVKMDGEKIIDEFQTFIKPEYVDKLTPFCTELTGITFDDLENAPSFNEAIINFHEFIYGHTIYSCGEFDRKFLSQEIAEKGISQDHLMARNAIESSHVNLKRHYKNVTSKHMRGMIGMAKDLNVKLKGVHHRGLDDARNLAYIYIRIEKIRKQKLNSTFSSKMTEIISDINKYHREMLVYEDGLILINSIDGEVVKLDIKEFIDKWSKSIIIDHKERGASYLSQDELEVIKRFSK